jgi:hypothetical protein
MMNLGMSSTPTDLDFLRRLMALVTFESETDGKSKSSEDGIRAGKTIGQGLLYTDRKCSGNSSEHH